MTSAKVLGILLLLALLWAFLAVAVPESFLTGNNIENLLRRTAMYGILGIGVAFVIITGGIDLSIGSIVCLSACLLALMLRVEYRPVDDAAVLAVWGQKGEIWISSRSVSFRAGDQVRYYGGRRAANALLDIQRVDEKEVNHDGQSVRVTALYTRQPLSSDDRYGHVAKVARISDYSDPSGSRPTVSIAGAYPGVRPRDQIVLVHPEAGLKQLTILAVQQHGDETRLTLHDSLGAAFSRDWLAIPLKRHQRMPSVLAVGSVLGVSILLGLVHGLLVTKAGLQPFVVTLCGLLFYRGIARWIVGDQPQGFGNEYLDSLSALASGKLQLLGNDGFGIPYPFFIMAVIACLAAVFLNQTIWGRYMQALGRNKQAAEYSGINTDRMTAVAYILCTVSAAVGGMLFALDANSVSPSSFGNFFELYAIAAAVLGGCSLRGGEGGILGVIAGTAVMQTLYNLIVLVKISDQLEFAIIGAVILAGVLADETLKRYAARRRARAGEI